MSCSVPARYETIMRQCQSCGMPLHTERAGDCRGSEVDGTRSERWCSLCYVDGAFVDPDCTLAAEIGRAHV